MLPGPKNGNNTNEKNTIISINRAGRLVVRGPAKCFICFVEREEVRTASDGLIFDGPDVLREDRAEQCGAAGTVGELAVAVVVDLTAPGHRSSRSIQQPRRRWLTQVRLGLTTLS